MQKPLQGKKILVVEDEAIIGMYTEDTLVDAGALVLGPVATLKEAFAVLDTARDLDAVALDLNLNGDSSGPLADALAERELPFIMLTGYDTKGIPEGHRDRPLVGKPYNSKHLVEAFVDLLKP